MGTINELFEAVRDLYLRESLPIIITETGPEIVKLVQSQLEQGNLANGSKIVPPYASDEYAKIKSSMNPLAGYGVPDIKYSGQLYANMYAEATGGTYDIESTVDYAKDKNILQYGDQLLALSEANKEKYCEQTLLPAIQEYITEKTGLIFE